MRFLFCVLRPSLIGIIYILNMERVSFKKILDTSFIVLCLVLFFTQVWDVWEKYASKATTVVIGYKPVDLATIEIRITICPFSAYKEPTVDLTPETYMKKTFSRDEIFHEKCFEKFHLVHELNTSSYGRCFTLSPKKISLKKWGSVCDFKNTTRLKVITHLENEELWLQVFEFPLGDGLLKLNLGLENVYFSSLKIIPTEINISSKCKNHDQTTEFIDCFKQSFSGELYGHVTCKLPGMELVLANSSKYNYCSSSKDVRQTLAAFGDAVDRYAGNVDGLNCPIPCKFLMFSQTINDFHRTSWVIPNVISEDEFKLDVSLESPYAKVQTETQMYDFGNSIGQLGGNLGLLLGFSCISAYFYVSGLIMKFLKNKI